MSIPYIIGMGVAYTAALGLLMRRLRLPGRGYLPEKTLCSLCFVVVAAVCAALGSRPEAFWHLLPGAAVLCGGGCADGALQPPAPSGPVSGGTGGFSGRTRSVCMGPVPAAAHRLACAAGRGAGGGWRGGTVRHTGHADRADAPLGGALRSLCLGTAGQGTAAGLWHGRALVLSGAGRGSAVLDLGSADPVFVFLPFQAPYRACRQSFDLLLCHVSDCRQPRVLRMGTV